jgi:hypothetical protein
MDIPSPCRFLLGEFTLDRGRLVSTFAQEWQPNSLAAHDSVEQADRKKISCNLY